MINKFSKWLPEGLTSDRVSGIVVLVPPSQSDGRDMVRYPKWQEFATKHNLALVGCYFQDDVPSGIEKYCDMRNSGSGRSLLNYLFEYDLGGQKLFLWGFSAGGQFNYEFACNYPHDVAAFVVNKGGIYYTALASKETRQVPGMFFVGKEDSPWRQAIVRGIYAVNKACGAKWVLINEDCGHSECKSEEISIGFFESILQQESVNR